uniref:Beta-1,4-N-acetylgalactosaminyltransferase n=1 Tax=Erpetoichthys calabaricus TaxID=27687 RepID=A0A8C4RMB5_ERPCA
MWNFCSFDVWFDWMSVLVNIAEKVFWNLLLLRIFFFACECKQRKRETLIDQADLCATFTLLVVLNRNVQLIINKRLYKGQANLHVFEDWCGSAVSQLRKNLHFPLYPHTRTVVKKLAVAPKWKNYGLRIFGYIHPPTDGDFQFAIASDDNSEFWLSSDEDPMNARLLVFVGKLGSEWTAPGEFTKFRSQVSKPVHLISLRRYFFEILHKQDEKGSDHVEVGWRPFLPGLKFEVIDSSYVSLYTDESSLKMNSVEHIPQTYASHARVRPGSRGESRHGADMLKPDPRDTFFLTPLIDASRLKNVLPACLYSPTYVVKDFPIARYQGLQFVYLSFVYPNDFTRLTHMETENKCFYRESPIYLEKFGFYKYMKMDEEEDDRPFFFPNPDDFLEEEEGIDPENESLPTDKPAVTFKTNATSAQQHLSPRDRRRSVADSGVDYGDDDVDYTFRSRQKANSAKDYDGKEGQKSPSEVTSDHAGNQDDVDFNQPSIVRGKSLSWIRTGPDDLNKRASDLLVVPKNTKPNSLPQLTHRAKQILTNSAHAPLSGVTNSKDTKKEQNKVYITRPRPNRKSTPPRQPREVFPGMFLYQIGKTTKLVNLGTKLGKKGLTNAIQMKNKYPFRESRSPWLGNNDTKDGLPGRKSSTGTIIWNSLHKKDEAHGKGVTTSVPTNPLFSQEHSLPSSLNKPKTDYNSSINTLPSEARVTSYMKTSEITESQLLDAEPADGAEEGGLSDYSYEDSDIRQPWVEEAINWQRTFTVNTMDFELLRSDWNDLRCNVSGNLQLSESEVVDVLAQYMEKLNEKNGGIYTLLRIINVEKRRDSARGNRYLIELELMERGKRVVRLSEYVYMLLHRSRQEDSLEANEGTTTTTTAAAGSPDHTTVQWSTGYSKPLLCQPVQLQWRHDVMVHFVVPVKNQARWVQQFITDMELLYQETKDDNFSIIIVDFESDDMDVEQALKDSKVPRYHYMRKEGNFERSAGLQSGVDSVEVTSLLFACPNQIHFSAFPHHYLGHLLIHIGIHLALLVFSSGYWEVNGFGLFGIYKSDFDKIGGMNTNEFRDQWGGEDWELLDRVLQNGLEVERLRLRNFFHYYHSKRGMWNSQVKKGQKG